MLEGLNHLSDTKCNPNTIHNFNKFLHRTIPVCLQKLEEKKCVLYTGNYINTVLAMHTDNTEFIKCCKEKDEQN